MINQRFRNYIKLAKTLPGADINSDHSPTKTNEDKNQRTNRPRHTKTTRI